MCVSVYVDVYVSVHVRVCASCAYTQTDTALAELIICFVLICFCLSFMTELAHTHRNAHMNSNHVYVYACMPAYLP